jgi:hypothetical protein
MRFANGLNLKEQTMKLKINHFSVSMFKSMLRIGAGAALILSMLPLAGVLLVTAELFGIIEEIV